MYFYTMSTWFSEGRKYRAQYDNMKITYFQEKENNNFRVGILGSRSLPYILNFETNNVSCTCPDYTHKSIKPICKHLYFLIHLAKNDEIFQNSTKLEQISDEISISTIKSNLLKIIDSRKMQDSNSETNTVSIERDDCCAICMCDLQVGIDKCSKCKHVMHISCLKGWWELSSNSWDAKVGTCAFCRDKQGFSHIQHKKHPPWDCFAQSDEKIEDIVQILEAASI